MRTDLCLNGWNISGQRTNWADDFYESVFFLGNGRMGVRGYLPGEPTERPVQRGMYVAGIFGEIKPGITDIVHLPAPNFSAILLDGKAVHLVSPIEQSLSMDTASMSSRCTLSNGEASVEFSYLRFFPQDHPGLMLQRLTLLAQQDAELEVQAGLSLDSCNCPVPDDQTKDNQETLQLIHVQEAHGDEKEITCRCSIQGTLLTVSWQLQVQSSDFRYAGGQEAASRYHANVKANQPVVLDMAASILTSRDVDARIAPLPPDWHWDTLWQEHVSAWNRAWAQCTMAPMEPELLTALRYAAFQLMGSCSSKDPTVSIGARGLTHGRYKGCYFWDTDLFMLPFFLKNDLEAAKNLCLYRVNTLDAARAHAKAMNADGARYPWMAALDGSEQCESWDIGASEVHITADVSFALDAYLQASGDEAFYLDYAAEVYVETARFWQSRYTWNKRHTRANLLFCKGPDEYCGITSNNLYTNVMVQHNLNLAIQAAEALRKARPQTYEALSLTPEECAQWAELRNAIPWPRDPDTGHLTQDETFHQLEAISLEEVKRDLSASYHQVCFDRLQRYRLIKQADVLLLMTRFPTQFSQAEKIEAWETFEPICLHDSTLSFASHALFALQNGLWDAGMAYLSKALLLDLRDLMGNTGKEGLHLACMGEAWQAAQLAAHSTT